MKNPAAKRTLLKSTVHQNNTVKVTSRLYREGDRFEVTDEHSDNNKERLMGSGPLKDGEKFFEEHIRYMADFIARPRRIAVTVIGNISVSHTFIVETESMAEAEQEALKRAEEIAGETVSWSGHAENEVSDFEVNEIEDASIDQIEDTIYVASTQEYPAWYKGEKSKFLVTLPKRGEKHADV